MITNVEVIVRLENKTSLLWRNLKSGFGIRPTRLSKVHSITTIIFLSATSSTWQAVERHGSKDSGDQVLFHMHSDSVLVK